MEATEINGKLSMNCERDLKILGKIANGHIYFSEILSDMGICSIASDTIIKEHLTALAGHGYIFKDSTDKYYLSEHGQDYLAELKQGIVQQTINGQDSELPCEFCGQRFKSKGLTNHYKSCPALLELESRERLADQETISKLTAELGALKAVQNLPPSEVISKGPESAPVQKEMVSDSSDCLHPGFHCSYQSTVSELCSLVNDDLIPTNPLKVCAEKRHLCQEAEKKVNTPGIMTSKEAPGYPSEAVQTSDDTLGQMMINNLLKALSEWNLSGDLAQLFIEAHGTPTTDPIKDRAVMLDWNKSQGVRQ